MRRGGAFLAAACTLAAGFALRPAPAAVPSGRWVSGDLHVRSTYSGDSCRITMSGLACDDDANGMNASPAAIGVSAIDQVKDAEERGLAFIAITDLDTPASASSVSAQTDPDIAAYKACHDATPATCPVLILDGIEKALMQPGSVPGGHALAVGYSGTFPADPTPSTGWTNTDLSNTTNGAIKKIHDAGGVFLAEGPGNPSWKYPLTGSAAVPVDGYDVWRGLYVDQSEFTGADAADNPQADAGWRTAVTNLAAGGKKLTAFGGSGASRYATESVEGPGQPSVWVFDTLDVPTAPVTWSGIKDAIMKGRVKVSSAIPSQAGPLLQLDVVDASNNVLYFDGDNVPFIAGGSKVHVAWSGAPLGATIRIIGVSIANGSVQERGVRITVDADSGSGPNILFTFPKGAWYRAEMYLEDDAVSPQAPIPGRDTLTCPGGTCFQDRYAMLALSGTIYGS